MSTKVTDLTPLVTTDDADVLHIVDVGDETGGTAGTSKKITVSNLLASAGSVDSVNGQTGVVVLEMNDIDDVNASTPADNIVLSYDTATSKYIADTRLTTLYTEFRNGTAVNVYADGVTATQGRLELTSTTANVKSGVTGMTVTETSPGDVQFAVATGSSGGTAFTALHLDGTTTASEANLIVKLGCFLAIEGSGGAQAKFRSTNSGNTLYNVPASSGTLALTSDIPSAGIAAVVDDTTPQLGGNLDVQAREIDTSTTNGNIVVAPNGTGVLEVKGDTNDGAIQLNCNQNSHGVKIQSPPHSAAASYTLVLPDDTGTNGQVLTTDGSGNLSFTTVSGGGGGTITAVTGTAPIVSSGGNTPAISITAATTSAAGSMSSADKTKLDNATASYEEDELKTGMNATMNTSVSVASNKIVDIMGDALADTSNANSKKFLGFHTGSSVCVLQGMVDAVASISGASAGSPLWIGASGAFSATAPTTTNYYSRVVGHYIGTGQGGEELVYFNPSQDWVQIS